MNIYMVDIWGPCPTTEEVTRLRSGPRTDMAVAFAPTKDIANQLCYFLSTRELQFQPNYQEVNTFAYPISCILHTNLMPVTFADEIVKGLIDEPVMPALKMPDTQKEPGMLFFARCIDESKEAEKVLKAEFWIYDRDEAAARQLAFEYGSSCGCFDPNRDRVRVELLPMVKACVFWNVKMVQPD
jgi:hypothetical protein